MAKQRLTDRIITNSVGLNDLIHVVKTGDTSQNPAGSSYASTIGVLLSSISGGTVTGNYLPLSGGTVSGATNFTNGLTANTISTTNLLVNGVQITGDTYVTGGTYSSGTLTFTNNQNNSFQVTGVTSSGGSGTFTGNTSATCITDLYLTNLHGCSPITVHDEVRSIGSTSTGILSFSFGDGVTASGDYSHAEGYLTIASGTSSHAEGSETIALGDYSHAEGYLTIASGDYSHAEGYLTIASGTSSHAEGGLTIASGTSSHAEGYLTIASGDYSHAEGSETIALGDASHAEGYLTIASGDYSHAEGYLTIASGTSSHAEGGLTIASGTSSHAEGYLTIASGDYSHAEGSETTASGLYSHAEGIGTIAYEDYQHVSGRFNNTSNASQYFIIGGGTSNVARANLLRVSSNGNLNIAGTLTMSSADYAEYFESLSGDSLPFGTVVELVGKKIKVCENPNNAIGVISSKPLILGNAEEGTADEWIDKYEKDEWGRHIMEDVEAEIPVGVDSKNKIIYKKTTQTVKKISVKYNPNIPYIPRSERPEWNIVGLLGQIRILKNQQIPSRWIKMEDINDEIALYLVR